MYKKHFIVSTLLGIVSLFIFITPALAHVIVYPHQAGIAATQDFTVSVPNERNNPVTSVKLLIPKGLLDVSPNSTPGWDITTKSKGSGDNETVREIDWNNGSIPVGQRAEFVFQAQVPPTPTTLPWKAYQTYSDGTIVSWDVDPAKMHNLSDAQQDELADKENKGEYSTTQVINDLSNQTATEGEITSLNNNFNLLMIISGGALIIAIAAFVLAIRKK